MWTVKYDYENKIHQHDTFDELFYETLAAKNGIPKLLISEDNDHDHLKEIVEWWISKTLTLEPNPIEIIPFSIACFIASFIESKLSYIDNIVALIDTLTSYVINALKDYEANDSYYIYYTNLDFDVSKICNK